MRVLLDTNILVRANPRAGGSARTLFAELARSPEHTLILSPFLLEEVERVLAPGSEAGLPKPFCPLALS
jgi:predicted nucleic acid-binding protein